MKRELKLGEEVLVFKMTNRTIFEIDEKYNNFGDVINGVMHDKNLYNNSLKVLECSCCTREIEREELLDKLEPHQITQEIVPLAVGIYFDYMGVKPTTTEDGSTEKK